MGFATELEGNLANLDLEGLANTDISLVNDLGAPIDADFGVEGPALVLEADEPASIIFGDTRLDGTVLGVGNLSTASIGLLGLVQIQVNAVQAAVISTDGQNYLATNAPLDAANLTASATVGGVPIASTNLTALVTAVNNTLDLTDPLNLLGRITLNDILNNIVFDFNVIDGALFPIDDAFVICFARGTMIETAEGPVAVENLKAGDMVLTKDHGLQPIRWIGSQKVSSLKLDRKPELCPIRIKAGALGANTPTSDLLVSPQHRILVRSNIAQKMFGTKEVLVAAKQLVLLDGIDVASKVKEVEYFHFIFDQHEVVVANGAEAESLFTGPEALNAVGAQARQELLELFPELVQDDYEAISARTLTSGRVGRRLAQRHVQNRKALVQ